MADELLRPFIDKIRARPQPSRTAAGPLDVAAEEIPADSILIQDVRAGAFPEALRLQPAFVPGLPRIRMTIDLGAQFRGRAAVLESAEIEALREFCPQLAVHDCGGGDSISALLAGGGGEVPVNAGVENADEQ